MKRQNRTKDAGMQVPGLLPRAHGFLTLSVISVMEVIQGYQRTAASGRIQAFRNAITSFVELPSPTGKGSFVSTPRTSEQHRACLIIESVTSS